VTDVAALSLDELDQLIVRSAEELSPELWLCRVLPAYVGATGHETLAEAEDLFAGHHRTFWSWCWSIEPGERPAPFVGVWPRGGAKSTSAEMGTVALGCRAKRRYGLYVCGTQAQADDHVGNVGTMLQGDRIERWYPAMASRLVDKFGTSKGWRRNRLRTATGFTLDAIGLDTAARGVKMDDQRPDFLVIDDIDLHDDSPGEVQRKILALTKALIPAGAPDLAILAIQNLIHRDGVFARLVDGRARFMARRQVSGPVPAVRGLVTRHEQSVDELGQPVGRDVVVAGEPTWVGQSLERVQEQIDDMGLMAFLAEAQHEVNRREGALWVPEQLATIRRVDLDVPDRLVVAVDPSGGSTDGHDAQGIVVAGRAGERAVVLDDLTGHRTPAGWGDVAVQAWDEWDADAFVVEVNFGGDMCADVLRSALERLLGPVVSEENKTLGPGAGRRITLRFANNRTAEIRIITASRGKRARAEPVAALYGRLDDPETWATSSVVHAGHFAELEDEMTGWSAAATWSPNRMDALVWALTDLMLDAPRRGRRRSIVATS
jgi:hypothetical protein